jgi:two-component system probable response regulator PhcQ
VTDKPDSHDETARLATLLVVDDEPEILEGLRRALRREPYKLVSAGSADAALAALESEPVDILISDIDMPGTNGLELVARVRREHPGVIRMLLTGDASLQAALHAINHGEVFRFLIKPWDKDELRALLREAVARLDELRRAATVAAGAGAHDRLKAALERAYPGITNVELDGDLYHVDPARLRTWLESLTDPRLVELFGAAEEHDEREHTRRLRK